MISFNKINNNIMINNKMLNNKNNRNFKCKIKLETDNLWMVSTMMNRFYQLVKFKL